MSRRDRESLSTTMPMARFARYMTQVTGEEWTTRRARDWAKRNRCARKSDRHRWSVTIPAVRRAFPGLWADIEMAEAWDQ